MEDLFDMNQLTWSFNAMASAFLKTTTLPITFPAATVNLRLRPSGKDLRRNRARLLAQYQRKEAVSN